MAPLPTGAVGEIYISGCGLAEGYYKDPVRTSESFKEHPVTGEKHYATGDMGRLRDGYIEFLGRLDSQVKIRGQRIELGEIEVAIESHPNISRAVFCRQLCFLK